MSNLYKSITVALKEDTRKEEVDLLVSTIKQFALVIDATPTEEDMTDWIALTKVRQEIGQKIIDILYPRRKNE